MIKMKNLSKSFGDHLVLNDINLEINEGEMVAILGESGSGKSTLLNIIGLIEGDYEGEYYFKNNKKKLLAKYIKYSSNSFYFWEYLYFYLLLANSIGLSFSKSHSFFAFENLRKVEIIANIARAKQYQANGTISTGETFPSEKPEAISSWAP